MRGRHTTATPSVPPTPRPAAPLPPSHALLLPSMSAGDPRCCPLLATLPACPPAIRRCCPLLASLPACPPAIRRCCPLLASLPARPPAIRRCCPSPITLHARPPATQPLSSLLLSFQAEHPPPCGREGLDVANQGNRGPESTRQVVPSLPCPPPKAQHLHERPYLLKPLAPTISSLVQRTGRPHGRPGRPTSPLPCTNPIPLALHADRWPCGLAVTQYTAEWRVLGSNPPSWHVSRRSDGAFCSQFLSFQAEHPPPGGRGGLDVANQGNRGPESTRQVVPPSSAPPPPQSPALAREALPSQTPCSHHFTPCTVYWSAPRPPWQTNLAPPLH